MNQTLIELGDVKIRVEWPENDEQPMAVVPLDAERGTFLLISTESLASMPPGWLDDMRQALRGSMPESSAEVWPDWIRPTPQKERAVRELRALGYNVSDGREYGMQKHLDPNVTLKDVQKALSKIEGSLSDFVIAERKKQW